MSSASASRTAFSAAKSFSVRKQRLDRLKCSGTVDFTVMPTPPKALAAFGKVLQGVLQLAARNFEIYMESYKAIVTAGL